MLAALLVHSARWLHRIDLNTFNEICEPETTPGSQRTAEHQISPQACVTAIWQPGTLLIRKRGLAEGREGEKGGNGKSERK